MELIFLFSRSFSNIKEMISLAKRDIIAPTTGKNLNMAFKPFDNKNFKKDDKDSMTHSAMVFTILPSLVIFSPIEATKPRIDIPNANLPI